MKKNLPKKLQQKIDRVQKASIERAAEIERRKAEEVVHSPRGKVLKKKA